MSTHPTRPPTAVPVPRPGWDVLLLTLLVIARLRIDSLAEVAVLPHRYQDALRHPLLGQLLPPHGIRAMGEVAPAPGEPVALLLIALTLGLTLGYALVDLVGSVRWRSRLKWLLLTAILISALFLPTVRMMLLRQGSGPASYAHDGGVIQTEAAVHFLLSGRNPYVEDYTETAMAEWGFSAYRTALYHYPYLPWSFLFSAPFYLLGEALGFYDQRLVYLLLMAIALALAPKLVAGERRRLALVALLGLNPMMASDLIYGQNDSFVLCWILFSLVAWRRWQVGQATGRARPGALLSSTLLFGLACASKPTAWFAAPFYGLLLVQDLLPPRGLAHLVAVLPTLLARALPALIVCGLLLAPYLVWDSWAFYDDVWRWSAGLGETGYQIWGWGASNFVLALGLVPDRFASWPFWLWEVMVATPLLFWFLHRQQRANSLAHACWHYGLFLGAFFYVSRFLNENYLGYILAFLAVGWLSGAGEEADA